MEKSRLLFPFAIRSREDDRLLGFLRLHWIQWTAGAGYVTMGIGDPQDRGRGYGGEALRLGLRFAFREVNLRRLSALVYEYNPGALRFFERAGFQVEVRRRQALHRDGRRWDLLLMGLLREEWRYE